MFFCKRWYLKKFRPRTAFTLAVLVLLCASPGKSFALAEEELQIALLLKAAQFSTWPTRETEQFNFCLYRGQGYEAYTSDQKGKPQIGSLFVRFVFLESDAPSYQVNLCHLLFITESSAIEVKQMLRRATFAPTLTASTLQGFADLGGMIELRKRNNRYGFRINLTPIAETDLKISSSLLEISDVVRGDER